MSAFLSELEVVPYPNTAHPDGVNWRLLQDLVYQSDLLKGQVVVPAGFLTDFASTPRVLWNSIPPWGVYGPATVIHDWLYWTQPCTREQADGVLLEGMRILGTNFVVEQEIYDGVRAGGQIPWERDGANMRAGKAHIS